VPFWKEGIPAAYIHSVYYNPYEHSRGDTVDKIDFDLLEKVAAGVVGLVVELSLQGVD
jgi:hypothetical protein